MTRSRRPCRRPTLADLLILIAAMGVGLAVMRPWVEVFAPFSGSPLDKLERRLYMTIPCGWALNIAWMVIRWRRPRPDRLRLMRQPGSFACYGLILTAAMAFTVAMSGAILNPSRNGLFMWNSAERVLLSFVPIFAGYNVLSSWGLLLLSGRWRCEPGWIDATGVLLGLYWVVVSLMVTFSSYFL